MPKTPRLIFLCALALLRCAPAAPAASGGGEGPAPPEPEPVAQAPEPEPPPAPEPPPLPEHPPAVATPLSVPEGALDHLFEALAAAESGEEGRIVRVLNWGDSTIAGDGIVSTVRDQLQARFGDGGPGFLTVHVDPKHAYRPGVAQWAEGEWESLSITFAGAPTPRYGLAGIASTATGEARSVLGGREVDGVRQKLHRFDLFYQYQPGGGSFAAGAGGVGAGIGTDAAGVGDAFHELRVPGGADYLYLQTRGDGPVTFYGAALETAGPGLTWETLGVTGAGVGSMGNQIPGHLIQQVKRRQPDLIVYWTGANEWGYESVSQGDGALYQEIYQGVVNTLRSGAPSASCLLIGPLDQGTWKTAEVTSEPALSQLIKVQARAAEALGCAFWDARAAMGGEGSFPRWFEAGLAEKDRLHLSPAGKELIGASLADAILAAYEAR